MEIYKLLVIGLFVAADLLIKWLNENHPTADGPTLLEQDWNRLSFHM